MSGASVLGTVSVVSMPCICAITRTFWVMFAKKLRDCSYLDSPMRLKQKGPETLDLKHHSRQPNLWLN